MKRAQTWALGTSRAEPCPHVKALKRHIILVRVEREGILYDTEKRRLRNCIESWLLYCTCTININTDYYSSISIMVFWLLAVILSTVSRKNKNRKTRVPEWESHALRPKNHRLIDRCAWGWRRSANPASLSPTSTAGKEWFCMGDACMGVYLETQV